MLSKEYHLPITVGFSSSRGYYLSIPTSNQVAIPSKFIQAVQYKKALVFSTLELNSLSDRAIESITQAISISNNLIQDLLQKIRYYNKYIFALVDSVVSTRLSRYIINFLLNHIKGYFRFTFIFL